MTAAQNTGTRRDLRSLLESGTHVVPGVATPLEALLAEQAGFDALYISGYAVAATNYGVPDVGIIGRGEMVESIRRISAATDLPLLADADTGYGDAPGIARTVVDYESAGVSAIQIEDQVWPKRCGHLAGKEVMDRDAAVSRIQAAVVAKSPGTLVIGRTDSIATHGIDEAITRSHLFVEAGAELIFVDAPVDRAQLERIGTELAGTPLVVNVSEGGMTPQLTHEDFAGLGFAVVLYPSTSGRVLGAAVSSYLAHLRQAGTTAGLDQSLWTLGQMNDAVGLEKALAMGA